MDQQRNEMTRAQEEMLRQLGRLFRVMRRGSGGHSPKKLTKGQRELVHYLAHHGPVGQEALGQAVPAETLERELPALEAAGVIGRTEAGQLSLVRPRAGQLSGSQGAVLHILSRHGEMRSGELAERMDLRPSSLTEKLDRLSEKGLIVRRADPQDGRRSLVSLSEAGRRLLEAGGHGRSWEEQRLLQALTEEEAAVFAALCKKISDHMEEASRCQRGERAEGHRGGPHKGQREEERP